VVKAIAGKHNPLVIGSNPIEGIFEFRLFAIKKGRKALFFIFFDEATGSVYFDG